MSANNKLQKSIRKKSETMHLLPYTYEEALKRSKDNDLTVSLFNKDDLGHYGPIVFEDFYYSPTSFILMGHVVENGREEGVWYGCRSLSGLYSIMATCEDFSLYYDRVEKEAFFVWCDGDNHGLHLVREWSQDCYDDLVDQIDIRKLVNVKSGNKDRYVNVKDLSFLKELAEVKTLTDEIVTAYLSNTVSAEKSLKDELWLEHD